MRTKRHIAIRKAMSKKHLPSLKIITINDFEVTNMNLKTNMGTFLKRASLLTTWSENKDFQVQIELVFYKEKNEWELEYCSPVGDTSVDTTAPKIERMKQWERKNDFDNYLDFVQKNKDRMIQILLHEHTATKRKLMI